MKIKRRKRVRFIERRRYFIRRERWGETCGT
jgi:hypothetical protein